MQRRVGIRANKCFNPILTKTRLRAIHSNAIDPQLSEATAMRRSHILIIPSKQNTLRRPQFRHDVLSGITARITPKNLSRQCEKSEYFLGFAQVLPLLKLQC